MRRTTRKYILLLIVVLAIAGWLQSWRLQQQLTTAHEHIERLQALHQDARRQLRGLERQIHSMWPSDDEGQRLAVEERQYYQRRMMRLEERIAFLETAAATVRASERSPVTPQGIAAGDLAGHSLMDILMPVVTDPELRDLLRVQILATLEYEYEPLLAHYNYTLADEDTLLALLLEKRWNAMQYRLIMMQEDLDPDVRRHATEAIREDQQDLRTVLHDFLGAEDFATYETYEETQPERLQVDRFQQQLLLHDIPLTEDQQRHLILLLHEENTALETLIEAVMGDPADTVPLDPEITDLYREAAENHQQRILERAQSVLTDDQATFFEDFAAQQRALREAALHRNPAPDTHR